MRPLEQECSGHAEGESDLKWMCIYVAYMLFVIQKYVPTKILKN